MNILNDNYTGIQHIGIPVTNIENSKSFYLKLGFVPVMYRTFEDENGSGQCCMVKRENTLIELYQLPDIELDEIRNRTKGPIDHIAFNVKDITLAYEELKNAGFNIESKPAFLDFWDNGCKFFTAIGPDGERLEFNQIIKR